MVRIGIIGLGENGLMHLRGFDRTNGCEVVAACDPSRAARDTARKLMTGKNLQMFANHKNMLKNVELDVVSISTPTYKHAPIAMDALDAGLDILLEKPIAPTIEETDRLIVKAFDAGRVVQVGLVYRYSNLFRTMGTVVERGDFGNVMMAYCKEYRDNFPTQWFFETAKSGGAILDKNCHHFDLFSWFIRSKPVNVFAMGGQHVVKGKKVKLNCSYAPDPDAIIVNPDIVDHAFVLIDYENGAKANLGLCMYEVQPIEGLEIGIMGDNGAHALAKLDVVLNAGGGPLGEIAEIPVDYYNDNLGIGHIGVQVQHKEFIECVNERRLPYANLLLARESMIISLAAERSIKEGRVVPLKEFSTPKIEALYKKHKKELARPTPAPQPAPKPVVKKELTPQEELIQTLMTLLKMVFRPKVKGKFKEFSPELFDKIADTLNNDKRYLELSRGLNARVAFEGPAGEKAMMEFRDGRMFAIPFKEAMAEIKVAFTKEGWKELFGASNIQGLVMQRKIILSGRIGALTPYTEAFLTVAETIKKI